MKLIKEFDPTTKLIMVVCDPVHRVYSQFLHEIITAAKHNKSITPEEIEEMQTDELFAWWAASAHQGLKSAMQMKEIDKFTSDFFTKRKHLDHNLKDVVWSQTYRSIYSIFLSEWRRMYNSEELIIVDGTKLLTEPWSVMKSLQYFLGVTGDTWTKDKFKYIEDRKLFCLYSDPENPQKLPRYCPKLNAGGNGKGRSLHVELPELLKKPLRDFYKPYNQELDELEGDNFSEGWNW